MSLVSRALCFARFNLVCNNKTIFSVVKEWNSLHGCFIGKRFLYCSDYLGLENYKRQKSIMSEQIGSLKENFMKKVKTYVDESDQNSIFTEDLKMVVYFAETNEEINLVSQMIKKYHSQNNDMKFSVFKFGPLVMRLLHLNQNSKLAYELFNDKSLDGFFDQMTTYTTYLDLLYETKEYAKVLESMDMISKRNAIHIKYPVDCMTLVAAAAYKMNSKESLERLKTFLLSAKASECDFSLRTIIYSSMLAYKQGDPKLALELLSMLSTSRELNLPSAYINLKSLIYTDLGRYEESLHILDSFLNKDRPAWKKSDVFVEVLNKLKTSLSASIPSCPSNKTLLKSVEKLESDLQSTGNFVSESFEVYLDSTIKKKRILQDGYKQRDRTPVEGFRRGAGGVFSGSQRRGLV